MLKNKIPGLNRVDWYPLITVFIGLGVFLSVGFVVNLLATDLGEGAHLFAIPLATLVIFAILGMPEKRNWISLILVALGSVWVGRYGYLIIDAAWMAYMPHLVDTVLIAFMNQLGLDLETTLVAWFFAIIYSCFVGLLIDGKKGLVYFTVIGAFGALPGVIALNLSGLNNPVTLQTGFGFAAGMAIGLYRQRTRRALQIGLASVTLLIVLGMLMIYLVNVKGSF